MSLVNRYSDVPVSNRVGSGNYTYKCVLDTDETGIVKVELFADCVEQAIYLAAMQFGNVLQYTYIGADIISLLLEPYQSGTCILYL